MVKRKPKQSEIAAIEAIKTRIKSARAMGKHKEVAEYYNQLGNQHRLLGNFEMAIDAHQEEVNISKRFIPQDKMALGIAYRNMGEVLTDMRSESEAIPYIRKYLKIAQDCNNFVEQQRAFITLGRAYLSMAELAEREEGSEDNGNSENRLNTESALDKAFQNFRRAYSLLQEDELSTQLNDEKELMLMKCNNCQNVGVTLDQQGKHAEATSWLTKAIDIGNKYKFHDNLAPCYSTLCVLLLKDRKRKEALVAAKSATKTARILGNQTLEVEYQILEAKVLFSNDEVDAGKKLLKKLRQKIKKRHELHDYCEELDSLLTSAVRISRTQDALFVTDKDDTEAKMKLHEVLGDNYTTLMNYDVAIVHYKKACEFAVNCGVKGKKLSRLYFSIAETYRDLDNYESALKYYMEEMRLHSGNSEEEFKTQTNITVVLEKLQKPPEEVIEAHQLAIALAKMTNNANKEVTALTNYSLYLKSIGRQGPAEREMGKANDIKAKYNITNMDEPEPDSQELLDEEDPIDLDDLSEEEDSDDEGEDDKRTAKKRVSTRVNEAGESKLHIVAKKGDLKAVRRLIRQGHTVRTRDNAGWTPLHEACNFGHAAVVEELLKNGADVNDAGGALAEKITPLHDAACNCHCGVMKVLIKYGANVLAKDSEGRYPIDSLLAWRESDIGNDISENELEAYEEVKNLLKECMAKAGKPYRVQDEEKRRKKSSKRSRSPQQQSVLLVTKPYDEDCPILATTVVDDYDPDREGNGEQFYKSAMRQVGRKSLEERNNRKERTRALSPGPRGALIPSEKDFHQKHEDWLLSDDVDLPSTSKKHQPAKPKRKRDPMEDVTLDKRSTRRKTGNGSGRSRQRSESNDEEENSELMDVESPISHSHGTPKGPTSPSSDSISRNSGSVEIGDPILSNNFDEEDFSELLNDDLDLDDVPFANDDFLPSQMPARSGVEFGRTIDVPVVDDSGSDDNDTASSNRARTKQKASPTKRHRTVVISSDKNDDNFQTTSRNANKMKYSHLSTILKQANNGRPSDKTHRKGKSLVQTRLPVKIVPKTGRNGDSDASSDSPPYESNTNPPRRRNTSSSTLPIHGHSVEERKKEVLRLKIRILDKVLLVPVDDKHLNESIDWLAKECATRYLRSYGEKPILTLQTKDGASLLGSDPISLVLEANERELDGIVTNFDLQPLVERYCSACSDASLQVDPEIKSSLNSCQSSNILTLCDVYLRNKSATVLMNALQRQKFLRTLILSGCSLFDVGLSELCKALPTLSGLTELDISSNGITKAGFTAFSEVFLQQHQSNESVSPFCTVPIGLTSLVLSHNPLGNQIGTALAALLTKLTALRRLELSDCDLSEKLFLWSKNDLTKALNNSRLEELDISYNTFKDVGLEKFLQSLPARRMRSLNCSSCSSSSNVSTHDVVAKAVGAFLSGNEDCCNLKALQLNDCGLNDKSMDLILDNFDRLVRLENLELACNDNLTAISLVNILERSVERDTPLTNLDMGSIPNLWSTPRVTNEQVLVALTKKLNSQKKLAELRVPISDVESENANIMEDGSQSNLSKLEQKIVELMSDYAGSTDFHCKKQGACIIYSYVD